MTSSITVAGHEVKVDRATGRSTWWCTCGVKGAGPNAETVREFCDHLGIDENGEPITK